MANSRVIIKRRKAVRNIRKITNVMQKIATARYVKALRRATGTKPYVQKITELVANVAESVRSSGGDIAHPLLQPREAPKNIAVLVITSNRGLAGGYNGGVLRLANATLRDVETAGSQVQLHVSGKKGLAFFRFLKRPTAGAYTHISDSPRYADVEALADQLINDYAAGKIDGLKVVYQKFISVGSQKPVVLDVLPLTAVAKKDDAPAETQKTIYDFSPNAKELLEELIPVSVKIMLFQAFIDAAVSEQIARMVAMKAATDNAQDMVKSLTREYNRARQAQITKELSELMGGVEALK